MVPYTLKDMYKLLSSCALYITYGGYNSTMEIFKSNIPAIIIPRTDGAKDGTICKKFCSRAF